eukprot:365213-Chlamydomonas_euryale.AAC.17
MARPTRPSCCPLCRWLARRALHALPAVLSAVGLHGAPYTPFLLSSLPLACMARPTRPSCCPLCRWPPAQPRAASAAGG